MNNADLLNMDKKQLIDLGKLAITFKNQKVGKRTEFLQSYLNDIVKEMHDPNFNELLYRLELEAIRRDEEGENHAVEKVDRIWWELTYHHPKRGRIKISLDTLRNKLTVAKINKLKVVGVGRFEQPHVVKMITKVY